MLARTRGSRESGAMGQAVDTGPHDGVLRHATASSEHGRHWRHGRAASGQALAIPQQTGFAEASQRLRRRSFRGRGGRL
ncbi:uncharacterized protein BDZ99DRAFT_80171 [Mytilinidion resinicola]|uniref:Uncharacterized protein n=1 Tax=Mytilinidion resinicola TaxID=574789 RepID=A0A6A6YHH5_9PEZI|nr:uncharacterized protein BDZ99DRAFT_80171 [Mytilinidion resinicola]KAF2807454.1 hypothetical protein BDZ99DRAFT_80171 [Mytilinidion resinicola]